jgi:non-ribosomal peptide synthase protein (TIGR01720 family)
MVSRARQAGLRLSTKDLFLHQSIAELAPRVTVLAAEAVAAPVVGPAPLTPIQRWYFDTRPPRPSHFNQSMLVELNSTVDESALGRAVDALLVHHDALRMRFTNTDGQWSQTNHDVDSESALRFEDVSDVDAGRLMAELEARADRIHASLDISHGPLFAATLLRTEGRPFLLLVAHHLVVDAVSWRLLLDDLDRGYQQVTAGQPVDLGPKTTAFRDWARHLHDHVAAGGFDGELDHWLSTVGSPSTRDGCSAAGSDGEPRLVDAGEPGVVEEGEPRVVELDEKHTQALLHAAPTRYRSAVNDILLTALAWALAHPASQPAPAADSVTVRVELEGHGREEIFDGVDLSRTVGWFTSMYPVAFDVPAGSDPDWRALVRSVRRRLRGVPGNGLGYGALRHLGDAGVRERLGTGLAAAPVVFNYLGQWDSGPGTPGTGLYHTVHSSLGQDHDPANRRPHPLEVVGGVQDGRLQFSLTPRPDLIADSTVDAIADAFADALRQLADDAGGAR